MTSEEVDKELEMPYDDLCQYLLDKYGASKYDYFVNESCRSKSRKISRSSEGLFCHHMDEDKAILLSNPKWAVKNPFEYQKAERLVYCNALEHLILHIKIAEEPKKQDANEMESQGIGGALSFLIPELNHCYSGYKYKRPHEQHIYGLIADNFDDYIKILKYWRKITKTPLLVTPKRLSLDVYGNRVDRVYKSIKGHWWKLK